MLLASIFSGDGDPSAGGKSDVEDHEEVEEEDEDEEEEDRPNLDYLPGLGGWCQGELLVSSVEMCILCGGLDVVIDVLICKRSK